MSHKHNGDLLCVLTAQSSCFQAKKYAQAYQQLLEFGFSEDKIKSALLENEMDATKAIDKLLHVS